MASPSVSHQIVKTCIFEALMLLMEKKDYESITISDITRKAGVSRMAYYRNYNTKDDILLDYSKELIISFMEDIANIKDPREEDYYIRLLTLLKKNYVLFGNLVKADLWKVIRSKYTEFSAIIFEKHNLGRTEYPAKRWAFYFLTGGVLNIIIQWAETGLQESPEALGQIVSHLSKSFKESITV